MFHYVINHPVTINRKDNYLRAIGLMMSNTEYISQIDDDCWLEEKWLYAAINKMIETNMNYCFCSRRLWINDTIQLGIDTYESIGITNKFGYNLIETNSLVFHKKLLNAISQITHQCNDYGHDRVIANYLISSNEPGFYYNNYVGLNP